MDSRYVNHIGYLAPYCYTNNHLHDRKRLGGDHKKEMFNFHHASLRNAVERTFDIWKSRFRILSWVLHYSLQTHRDIIIACAVVHNFIMMSSDDEVSATAYVDDQDKDNIEQDGAPSTKQEEGHGTTMGKFWDGIVELM